MLGYVSDAIALYRAEGLESMVREAWSVLRSRPVGLYFGLLDREADREKTTVVVTIRGETPESDTFALVEELAATEVTHLCIAYRHDVDEQHLNRLASTVEDLSVVTAQVHTRAFVEHMLEASVVLRKQDQHLGWYRLFGSDDRRFYRLYHGPITKAYGNTRTNAADSGLVSLALGEPVTRSVNSDAELHFRSASEGRHPRHFELLGYPRFGRIRRFQTGESAPILPAETTRVFEKTADTTRILYATTHKDGVYETTFFPFDDFDEKRLREHLREQGIRLFVRPHPSNEDRVERLVDGETIFFAGQSFSNAATEILPYFDAMVTDYSSIYVEYLPLDRPILFVKDDHERFREIRGLAFDYERYFPGPKIDDFEVFLDHLTAIAEEDPRARGDDDASTDEYADRRWFVRETFVPEGEGTFTQRLFEEE